MGGRAATPALTLPTGLWRDGRRRRRAMLRWPSGEEERRLFEETDGLLPAERVTEAIARCVTVEGEPASGEPAAVARELSAGDRAALVLALRQIAFGDELGCVLACPQADCRERLELELRVGDLLAPAPDPPPPLLDIAIGGARVRFRLPSGADEERAARRALEDPQAATDELLEACLVEAPAERPAGLHEAVAAAMSAADPHAEILLRLTCPACDRSGAVALDPAAILFGELAARVERLEREIHELASHYGWSEREIAALGARRRRRYLELVRTETAAL